MVTACPNSTEDENMAQVVSVTAEGRMNSIFVSWTVSDGEYTGIRIAYTVDDVVQEPIEVGKGVGERLIGDLPNHSVSVEVKVRTLLGDKLGEEKEANDRTVVLHTTINAVQEWLAHEDREITVPAENRVISGPLTAMMQNNLMNRLREDIYPNYTDTQEIVGKTEKDVAQEAVDVRWGGQGRTISNGKVKMPGTVFIYMERSVYST